MGISFDADIEDDDDLEVHDINVTPFIDVMLVLLIIFMVAAPLSTVDLPVDLPSSTAVPAKKPDKPIYVTIKADLAVAVDETTVKRTDLVRSLDGMSERKGSPHFLRADRAVPYGELMDVLELLRAGGYLKIALVALEGIPTRRRKHRPHRQIRNLNGRIARMSDFESSQNVSWRMWALAALGA
jgi:biopolymer transport protein ExbD